MGASLEAEDNKISCYDVPISHTVRVLGSFAIHFEYRMNWDYVKRTTIKESLIKTPIKTLIVDDGLQEIGTDPSSVKDGEELFSYLVWVYNNMDRFNELFGTEIEEDEVRDKSSIMEQIVGILNRRFA